MLGVIDMFHFLQQGEGNAQRAADVDEGFDVLREAGAPVAQSRVEEVAGDSLVHADAFRHSSTSAPVFSQTLATALM